MHPARLLAALFASVLLASASVASQTPPATPSPTATPLKFASTDIVEHAELTDAPFRRRLLFEAPPGPAIEGVQIEVPDLVDAAGHAVPVRCTIDTHSCSESRTVAGGTAAFVDLTADVPVPGEYSTWVMLVSSGGTEARRLEVVRKLRATPSFSVLGAELATDGSLWLTLVDDAGMPTKLHPPVLSALARIETNRPKTQAHIDGVSARAEDGSPLPDPFDLPASGNRRIQVQFDGLAPGAYEGKLLIESPSGGRQQVPISLSMRLSAWIALACIAIGVLSSYLLRRWASARQPLLQKRQAMLQVRRTLDTVAQRVAPLDADERVVVDAVRGQLQEIDDSLVGGAIPAEFDTALPRLKLKVEQVVPAWIAGRRRVLALQPDRLRDGFRPALDAARAYLQARQPAPGDDAAVKGIGELDAGINAAVLAELRTQATQLKEQLDGFLDHASGPLVARLQAVREQVVAAEHLIGQADDAAAPALAAARAALANALMDDLLACVEGDTPRAPFSAGDANTWREIQKSLREQLAPYRTPATTGQDGLSAYQRACAAYLLACAEKLRDLLRRQREVITEVEADDDKHKGLKDELLARNESIFTVLETVGNQADARQTQEASTGWRKAWSDYLNLQRDLKPFSATLGAGAGRAGPVVDTPSLWTAAAPIPIADSGSHPIAVDVAAELDDVGARLARGQFAFAVLIGVLAVLLGWKLLWIDNPAWGTPEDWMIAFLWGLGLQQTSAGAFEGIAALADKFSKP